MVRNFLQQFISYNGLWFLEDLVHHEILEKLVTACFLAVKANQELDISRLDEAQSLNRVAVAATHTLLQHPRQKKEDVTLLATLLLATFEVHLWT